MTAALLAAVLLAATSTAPPDGLPAPTAWSLMRVVDGVSAWSAETQGQFWGLARVTASATPEAVFARIIDFDSLPGRYPWLERVRVLDRGDRTALVYFHYDFPWPIADRSYTARHRWWREPSGTIVLEIEDGNAFGPRADGSVRVEQVLGRFTFTPRDGGASTEVEYMLRADIAGMLPRTVRAQSAWKVPLNLVRSLRRSVELANQ